MAISYIGSISDWCMVIVTGITAFYLYKTLKSQQEVQKTQNKLLEIESVRFRESIKPVLKYSLSKLGFKLSEKDKEILSIDVINEANYHALEISVESASDVKRIAIAVDFSSKRRHLVRGDQPITLHFLADIGKINFIIFSLIYKDVAGIVYKQGVFCIHDNQGTEINPFLPEIVN